MMIDLLASSRWCMALLVWLSTWCVVGISEVQRCRTTLDIGLTLSNQQPAAFLASLDWGWGSRLVDAAPTEQQRSVDSCGPAALRRVLHTAPATGATARQGTASAEQAQIAHRVDAVLTTTGLGCTLGELRRAAAQLGLTGRILVTGDLNAIKPPAILHLRRGHFVVLESLADDRAQLFDPSHGVLHTNIRQLTARCSGAVLQLAGGNHNRPIEAAQP